MKRVSQGFALITAVIVLLVAASVALLLTNEVSMGQRLLASEGERNEMRYLIEAGFTHADWQLAQNDTCMNFVPLAASDFGSHSYNASFSPDSGSPVEVILTANHDGGVTQVVSKDRVKAFQAVTQTVLQPDSASGVDAYIWNSNPDTKYGSDDDAWVSNYGSSISKSLLQFDFSSLAPGTKIKNATLSMYLRDGNPPAKPVTAHRITNAWQEAEVTWNDRDNGVPWDTPGGDYDSAILATTSVGPSFNVRYEWDISDLVKAWFSGLIPNYGLILATTQAWVYRERFDTSEHSDPARRPILRIELACECGVVCGDGGSSQTLLLVVVNPSSLNAQELAKQSLIESWGYTVNLIGQSESQSNFDAAVAIADIAYVAEDIASGMLNTKLRAATIGVVIEEERITDEFGISSGETTFTEASIEVTNNAHYITEPFSLGAVAFASSVQPVGGRAGTLAPDLEVLALRPSSFTSMLDVIETGGGLFDTGVAAGRRVKLPWGGNDFDINSLTPDGQTIMQRAIEWGAGADLAGCASTTPLLFVVSNPASVSSQELARQTLLESWCYEVMVIDDGATQLQYDTEVAAVDVVYVSAEAIASQVGDKLKGVTIGVVNEDPGLHTTFGFSSIRYLGSTNAPLTTDAAHEITSPFGGAAITLFTSNQPAGAAVGTLPAGLDIIGLWSSGDLSPLGGLLTLDTGASISDGGTAAGRRVQMPWDGEEGGSVADINSLTADGETLLQRAFVWAAGSGGGGGGSPPGGVSFETFSEASLSSAGLSINVATPAGTASGDLLIAAVATDIQQKPVMTAPAGWTSIDHGDQSKQITLDVWWKIVGVAEPADYDFSWAKSAKAYGWIMRFTGHDPTIPINVTASTGGVSNAPVSPAVVTTVPNAMILRIGGFDDDGIDVGNPGLTGHTPINMGKSGNGTGSVSGGAGYLIQSAVGDSGTSTFWLNASEEYRAVTIAITPE